jgi:hypothetical protein
MNTSKETKAFNLLIAAAQLLSRYMEGRTYEFTTRGGQPATAVLAEIKDLVWDRLMNDEYPTV